MPRAMYSLSMSFCMVPLRSAIEAPCSSAATMYMPRRTMAGALMVMDVLTASRGIPSNKIFMSSTDEMDTPTFPTSPNESSSSASKPNCVGKSNATERPIWPRSSNNLNRSLVASALENPAYCRMVQRRERYMVS